MANLQSDLHAVLRKQGFYSLMLNLADVCEEISEDESFIEGREVLKVIWKSRADRLKDFVWRGE